MSIGSLQGFEAFHNKDIGEDDWETSSAGQPLVVIESMKKAKRIHE